MKKNNRVSKVLNIYLLIVFNLGQSMYYIQAWKIFTVKTATGVSAFTYIIGLILLIHWWIYGFLIKDKVLILSEFVGILGCIIVLIEIYIYS